MPARKQCLPWETRAPRGRKCPALALPEDRTGNRPPNGQTDQSEGWQAKEQPSSTNKNRVERLLFPQRGGTAMRPRLVGTIVIVAGMAAGASEFILFSLVRPGKAFALLGALWVAMPYLATAGLALLLRRHRPP